VVINSVPMRDVIVGSGIRGLAVAPSTMDLAGAEIELVGMVNREGQLRRALEGERGGYEYVLVDCPPSLGLLTLNALTAADSVMVPIQCEYYALEGLGQLMKTIALIQQRLNPGLKLEGVVLTMFDGRTNLSIQVAEEVKRYFRTKVYRTLIPRSVRLSEAPSHGKPITLYDARCRGAEVYKELAKEVMSRAEEGTGEGA
ncbi:MAG: ParA family protein, partial [Firmicutes bacterium]|nr:ParA family protein [Bacillota bacterium]